VTLVPAGGDDAVTDYERRALQELYDWKHPPDTWRARAADQLERGIEEIAARLPMGPLEGMLERGLPILNRVAAMTAPEALILAAYRRKGHAQVRSLQDIAALGLEDVERVVGTKRFAELVKGAGEGGVAGFYGAAGAAADVPALLGLALRSVNVFAYSYGFDPTTEEGHAYALSVIAASAALGGKAKQVTRAAVGFGRRIAGKEITQRLLERLPRELMVRLAAMSTPKAAPLAGAATGAAFNAWFLQSVAVHARFAYRQKFLERRHGPELLEAYGL
jgi:EcsC protein family